MKNHLNPTNIVYIFLNRDAEILDLFHTSSLFATVDWEA